MSLRSFVLRVRRRETPFYARLNRIARAVRRFELPDMPWLFKLMYRERAARLMVWRNFVRVAYHQPVFKGRCERVGRGLYLYGGIPLVLGHLRVVVGENVTISGVTSFAGSKAVDDPVLEIGDRSHIGHQTMIYVGRRVTIGRQVHIAQKVMIFADDMHPLDPEKRWTEPAKAGPPLVIGDGVLIASGATLYKGITVGEWAVVAPGSVVMGNVDPYTVVAGNPARVIWRIPRRT